MTDTEWKPGSACKGMHLLVDFYRETPRSIPRVNGTRCAPIQHQAGMSSVMIGCNRDKCPVLAGQHDETLTEQTNFVLRHANERNRDTSTLMKHWNQFPSFRAHGIVDARGTVVSVHYVLPEHLRRKVPRRGENYIIS